MSLVVPKYGLIPLRMRSSIAANSGPRWLIIWRAPASRTRGREGRRAGDAQVRFEAVHGILLEASDGTSAMVARVDGPPPPCHICRHMPTRRTTILADARPPRTARSLRRPGSHDEDRGHRRRARGVPRRARRREPGPAVPRHRPELARPAVARRPFDRPSRGWSPRTARPRADRTIDGDLPRPERRRSPPPTGPTSTTPRRSPGSAAPTNRCCWVRSTWPSSTRSSSASSVRMATLGARPVHHRRRDPARRTDRRRPPPGAASLLEAAREHRPRLADAVLVAIAERLGVRRIATFDRRPIARLPAASRPRASTWSRRR